MYRKILNWLFKKTDNWINRLVHFKNILGYKVYMDDFGYRDSDITIVTYPRSGTTLLQMVLYQITTKGEYDFDHLYDVSPWIKNDIYEDIKANKELNSPRIIKTHDPYSEFDPMLKGKIIFVIRDGLDAMYSLYKQRVSYGNPDLTLEEFSKNKLENNNDNWFYFNDPWLQNKKKRDILYLTYNDLVNHKEETVLKICNYLNIDTKPVDMDRVIERTSLDYMKKHQGKFGEREDKNHKDYDYSQFIRKGGFGDGKSAFNKTILSFYNKHLEQDIKPLLKQRGLKL